MTPSEIESYAERPDVDAEYFEALLVARRVLGAPGAQLAAIEAIDAAASALEHPRPAQDEGLARCLRLSVNVLLYLARHHSELIREVNELDGSYGRLVVRFTCPLCGTKHEPSSGEIVMGKPYQCVECMTALVFSVASPELDDERGVAPGEGAPQW